MEGAWLTRCAPDACEPRLLLSWHARGSIVMLQFDKSCRVEEAAPAVEIVINPVALAVPALLVVTDGIRAEQDAARFQCGSQSLQRVGQGKRGDMKQGGIGEDRIESTRGKIQVDKVLVPDFAPTGCAGHGYETRSSIQTNDLMSQPRQGGEVASWSATHIQNLERRRAFDVAEKGSYVLADIVVLSAAPKLLGATFVMSQCGRGNLAQR